MCGLTDQILQQERDEVLAATPQDIRSLAGHIRAFMEDDCLCVVGNAQKIKAEENLFMKTENLF